MSQDLLINYEGKPCYNIHIRDSFADFGAMYSQSISKKYEKVCIVTDSTVKDLYLDELKAQLGQFFEEVYCFSFKAGESSKNLNTVQDLYEYLIVNKFTRKSLLVALGGGVVGDLCGFAASTFLRGIDFIQVPTTLLSQVDSSVGGKTGVDFNQYKNMVGAFYMPQMVYMNVSALNTLDDANYSCGLGEVIKSALIQDHDFYYWLLDNHESIMSRNFDAMEYMVFKCCSIKGYVVEIDPKEQGIRSYLNFGHTLGHAIEKLSNFNLGHGQCVALGMVSATYLSYKQGYLTKEDYINVVDSLKLFNLPVKISGLTTTDVIAASKSDKKMSNNRIKFVILKSIGQADTYMDFSDDDLAESLKEVLE